MEKQNWIIHLIIFAVYIFAVPSILFITAGTIDWPMAWVYAIALVGTTVVSRGVMLFKNPETLKERMTYTHSENTASWDRFMVNVVGFLGPAVTFLVAGLDHRYGWSARLPDWVQYSAAVLVVWGYVFAVWAMLVNRFFSSVVRVQSDRGQTVIKNGPYRIVRHPGYAGTILACVALPLMLNAFWSFIPSFLLAAVLVVRTLLEDKLLQEHLEGYMAYTKETRFRVFPGIW
jgi:protein-S-isoprenylcysteine O-methyltransferase Ste14